MLRLMWKRDYGSRDCGNAKVVGFSTGPYRRRASPRPTKYGLGLAHIPTGSLAANQAYHDRLAWNLKTWLLNLLHGDGAVMRFQRFRYHWIWQAGTVRRAAAMSCSSCRRVNSSNRFGVAMARLVDSLRIKGHYVLHRRGSMSR